jgi:hypothetical protein
MAEFRPCVRQSRGTTTLLAGALWMGIVLAGTADGQAPPLATPLAPQSTPVPPPPAPAPRVAFKFVISPDIPLKDLLPIPPKAKPAVPGLIEDISQVPEVAFQEPLAKSPEALKLTAHTMAKINHLNRQKTDGFIEALLEARPDLAGLPMAMGDTCRTKGDRTQFFTEALNTIKQARGQGAESVKVANELKAAADKMERARIVAATRDAEIRARDAKIRAEGGGTPGPASSAPQKQRKEELEQKLRIVRSQIETMTPDRLNIRTIQDPDAFWEKFTQLCAQEDKSNTNFDPSQLGHVTTARIAALMQVLGPESIAMRKGLVKYLAATSHAEATRALAKLAIFSAEDEVRNPAIEALKARREKDYTDVLLRGLRYPLPAVAKRATEAMVKLERADLVPELVNSLEEPDPRAPTIKEVGEKKVPVVRELVRVNHHRNCLMCHSPAVPGEVPPQVTTAEVPRPDQPLPFASDGYNNSIPDVLVRLDVTYLRQDFSLMQPVADANPWPEMQRFDFLVRSRVLTEQETTAFPALKAGMLSPYQRVTLAALRELTGKDAAPTPKAWRKLLDLQARGSL